MKRIAPPLMFWTIHVTSRAGDAVSNSMLLSVASSWNMRPGRGALAASCDLLPILKSTTNTPPAISDGMKRRAGRKGTWGRWVIAAWAPGRIAVWESNPIGTILALS
jgi:hypothetical protein